MKNTVRMQAATVIVSNAIKDLIQGRPLPTENPEFAILAGAVERVARSDDQRWLGKAVILALAEDILAKNAAAKRQAAEKE